MADYKVGNLQIVFNAVDETSKAFENLSKNLRAVRNAILNIGKIGVGDMETFGKVIDTVTTKFSPLLNDIKGAEAALADFNSILQRIGAKRVSTIVQAIEQIKKESQGAAEGVKEVADAISTAPPQLSEKETAINDIWETFSERTIKSTLALKAQQEQLLKNKIAFLELKIAERESMSKEQLRDEEEKTGITTAQLREELKKLSKELNNNSNATKKGASGWKKFIKSIGRIALYRAIRRALQLTTQSITESIQEFAKLDDNINNVASQATSSLKVIQLSFGATFLPLLQAIAPILNQIAGSFANFANMISQTMATGDTYWAINADAVQDYREQLNKTTNSLAGFDKIQSLNAQNAQNDNSIFFEEREVEKTNETVQRLKSLFETIKDTISDFAENIKNFLSPISEFAGGIIDDIREILSVVNSGANDISAGLVPVLKSILPIVKDIISFVKELVKVVNPIIVLVSNFASGTVAPLIEMLQPIISKILPAISDALKGINVYLTPIAYVLEFIMKVLQTIFKIVTGLFNASAWGEIKGIWTNWSMGSSFWNSSVSAFADGGTPTMGTLFYAGEAGAETVTVGSSGRTEVTNVSQMETALYNALVRYGRENRGGDSAIQINIDGQRVFEATRRVANRKGLDFSRA